MPLSLHQRFSADSNAHPHDTRQIKKALNRLGYYTPLEKTGITAIPDRAVFDALKQFQKDHGLAVDGVIKPDDKTAERLSTESDKSRSGYYIWKTVGDGKVRQAHAQYSDTIRAWSDAPDPGDDFNCRCWAEALPNDAQSRKKAILGQGKADFSILPKHDATTDAPWYMKHEESQVNKYSTLIEKESLSAGVDADLVKAIIYIETTQGWYDGIFNGLLEKNDLNSSLRPMNIRASYWENLGYNREQLKTPFYNIQAGIKIIEGIKENFPQATIAEIATLYNDLNAKHVTDYGARVERLYKEKPWQDNAIKK